MKESHTPSAVTERLEDCLRELWQVPELKRTINGDYAFAWGADACWVRVLDDDSFTVAVFGQVVTNVTCTPELLTEINDMNSCTRGSYSYWLNGAVYTRVLVPWGDIDAEHLAAAINAVAFTATELGPTMAVVHGGFAMSGDTPYRMVRPGWAA